MPDLLQSTCYSRVCQPVHAAGLKRQAGHAATPSGLRVDFKAISASSRRSTCAGSYQNRSVEKQKLAPNPNPNRLPKPL
jgi:hypothetical protein